MARDFGASARPSWRRGQRLVFLRWIGGYVGLLAGLALFASLPTAMVLSLGNPNGDKPPRAQGGPGCRPISKARFLRGWKADPRVIRFQGVAFTRRRGDIFCGVTHDGLVGRSFAVCEFDSPVELAVAAGGRESYFDVGAGYSAVVEARPDGPRCVVTGLFRYYPGAAP
jgi:hypothetical protein